jgi:hypothetical protein
MSRAAPSSVDQSEVFAWDALGKFKAGGRFLDGYPDDIRTFRNHDEMLKQMAKEREKEQAKRETAASKK